MRMRIQLTKDIQQILCRKGRRPSMKRSMLIYPEAVIHWKLPNTKKARGLGTRLEKGIIRKRSKNYQLLEGVLHYKGNGGSEVCDRYVMIIDEYI